MHALHQKLELSLVFLKNVHKWLKISHYQYWMRNKTIYLVPMKLWIQITISNTAFAAHEWSSKSSHKKSWHELRAQKSRWFQWMITLECDALGQNLSTFLFCALWSSLEQKIPFWGTMNQKWTYYSNSYEINGIPEWNSKMELQNGTPKWNSKMELQNGTQK